MGCPPAVAACTCTHTLTRALRRRGAGCDRVGGTLLGSKEGNMVEVRNCYAVPLSEVGDQVRRDCTGGPAACACFG